MLVECKWRRAVKSVFTLEVLQNAFTKATFLRNLIPIWVEDPRIIRDLKGDVNSQGTALSSIILCMVSFNLYSVLEVSQKDYELNLNFLVYSF